MQKRRLEMMPEVLPAPTKLASRGNVRARTMQHMQQMVASATALGALGAVGGCTKSDTATTQTVTVPSATAATSSTSPLASATATAPPTTTTPPIPTGPPDHGYAVVDPMPMPSRCASAAQASKASATFVQQGKDLILKVTVKLGGGATWTGATVTPYSGTVKSMTANAAKDSLDIFLPTTVGGMSIPITCAAGTAAMTVNITLPPKPAKAGDTAPANVYDGY
ncbi:hypothetical protein BH09MYX1_BH09MYX1_53390 [soil metagenome]